MHVQPEPALHCILNVVSLLEGRLGYSLTLGDAFAAQSRSVLSSFDDDEELHSPRHDLREEEDIFPEDGTWRVRSG